MHIIGFQSGGPLVLLEKKKMSMKYVNVIKDMYDGQMEQLLVNSTSSFCLSYGYNNETHLG